MIVAVRWMRFFLLPVVLAGCQDYVVYFSDGGGGDRMEVTFSVYDQCGGDCDAIISMCRMIHLPNDPKPVHGIATLTDQTTCP